MTKTPSVPDRVACFGAACIDRTFRSIDEMRAGTSNPAVAERGFGGVARNVAENLARLGVAVTLCSVVGDDEDGRSLVAHLRATGADTSGVTVTREFATPQYAAMIAPSGELFAGAAEMRAIDSLRVDDLEHRRPQIDSAAWLFLDCNLPPSVIAACIVLRRSSRWRLAIDAVSVAKAQRLPDDLSGVDLLFLNEEEARACGGLDAIVRRGAKSVVLSRGPRGVLVGDLSIPALPAKPVDVTGAGDALVAGTLYGLLAGEPLEASVRVGLRLAARTVESTFSVRPDLSPALLADATLLA
jgi:pseudouridine kinase